MTAILFTTHLQWKFGLNYVPAINGDELEYDSLGWELSHGNGFQIDLSNTEFRQAYSAQQEEIEPAGPRVTSYRPPLVPWIMAVLNRLFDRQFWAIRLVNVAASAISCGMIAGLAVLWGGPLAGTIAGLQFGLIDWRVRAFSRTLLTESLALFWVTLLFVLLIQLSARPRIRTAVFAGVVLGLGILTRSMIAMWVPAVCGFIAFGSIRQGRRQRWCLAGVLSLAMLAVISPWVVRNLSVLRSFSPLGTQFQIEMLAGYSDLALQHQGFWFNWRVEGPFQREFPATPGLELEQQQAIYSSRTALQWIRTHPAAVLQLAVMKIVQEIRPWGIGDLYISILGLTGLIALRRTSAGLPAFVLLASCLFSIAVTWSTGGRFLIPVISVLHLGAAIAAAQMLEFACCRPIIPEMND